MRACVVFLCLLAASFALSIKSKPHGKHHGLHKSPHTAKEKEIITEEANVPQILPTLLPPEVSSRERQDEELSAEDNTNGKKEGEEFDETKRGGKSSAVLLSDEELLELLKQEAEEGKVAQERGPEEDVEMDKSGEIVEEEDAEAEKKALQDETKEVDDEEEVKEESADAAETAEEEEDMGVERVPLEENDEEVVNREERVTLLEDDEGSTESEIPVDLDYAADSSIFQPLRIVSTEKHTQAADDTQQPPNTNVTEEEAGEKGRPSFADDDEQNIQNTEAVESKEDEADSKAKYEEASVEKTEPHENVDPAESRSSAEFESGPQAAREEEGKNKNSGSHSKGKTRKQKKNQRARKHSLQRDEARTEQEQNQQVPQESEDSGPDSTAPKAKRRRAGKWGPLVGMNPVQIRATVDLYPSSRSSPNGGLHHPEGPADPCDNFPCKRGKTCKLDADDKPGCVCQEPSECPPSVSEFDHVCGTDNNTYDTSCELFATKCNLEGSKRGHRLHLDYTGPCKLIPACADNELVQFPLRMRDWLKNVLLQLYEHDSMSPGFLTPKQRFRVKKIFESERRLHAGDHSVELLAQDFEKNYNMYIYPVHWQFAQLDQHPSDRFLSHSELAPLRVPLVPMEHCTSRFFQECDTDRDKQVSFKEWISCFGIKNEDMDVNQLF